ncbi:Acyltransferase, C-terminal domain,Phospholipid/glycerol acyltransferase [Cinara cedri]|uniref:Acyltransferase, C-terminal domain,Phospholipid/glycerol acyltransferase n=1 Tax=Cinara cedri TaxID=506608 RepID=A0A5E4MK09_9HEMI|nr:Acyltransferase, C-terminal domain,Phospholipid/glycerol acyltransferase [Cinara cedri]
MSSVKSSAVFHALFAFVFFVSGLVVNSIQLLLFAILWPLNCKDLFRKINYYLSYIIYSEFVFLVDWWADVQFYFYADKADFNEYFGKEHAIFILNHKYEIDWLSAWVINERIGTLGNCKAFSKNSLKYMPIVGWCWWFSEFLFLQRDWAKDKYTIETQLKELFEYENPVTMLLYAEGTRFTKEKYEASLKFARSKGLLELKEHLLPRTKGFSIGLPHFRHNLPAVYNVQLAFKQGEKPSLTTLLNGGRLEAHVFMERIPIEQVPQDEKECDKWMYDVFEKKDKIMVSYVNTGDWFKENDVKPLEKFITPRSYMSLLNIIFWSLVTFLPFLYLSFKILISGNLLHIGLLTLLLCLIYVILSKLTSVSEIDKASSSYGTDKQKTK